MRLRRGDGGEGAAPSVFAVLAFVGAAFLVLPLAALVARAPWTRAAALLADADLRSAIVLSLGVATGATVLAAFFGLPLAWWLSRGRFPLRGALRALVTLPMVLPPVVAGVALLAAFGRRGLLGGALEAGGLTLPFTTAAAVLAAAFVSAPFFVRSAEAGLSAVDPALEAAAASLGASRWRIMRTVTLPEARRSLTAGLVLCWARALGEFGATITFAGNVRGTTRTLPLAVFSALQRDPDLAVLLGVLMLGLSLAVLVALRGEEVRP